MSDREGVLLCTEDERVRAAFPGADVVPRAVEVMERDEHGVVVLDDHADPATAAYLRSLRGARRRDLMVLLVGEDITTGDRDRAWRESVDMVVSIGDLDRMESILQEAVWDKCRFYERFRNLANAQGVS